MSGDSSEEKTLPASAKKLKKAREKGQIAKVTDIVTSLSAIAGIAYLFTSAGRIGDQLRSVLEVMPEALALPFDEALPRVLGAVAAIIAQTTGPLLALLPLTVLLVSVMANGGFVFALDPLMPKLETLDPIKGIGRLFALKSLVELVKSIVKAVVLGFVAVRLALDAASTLTHVPECGMDCVGPVARTMLRPMVGAACGLYLVTGGVDLLIQRWLFARELRMSVTEQKRERKDQDGDPHVRRAQRQQRKEATSGVQLGIARATLVIAGRDRVIGLRYRRGETDFPTVVCRATGEAAAEDMMGEARRLGVPVFWDDHLVNAMMPKLRPGIRILPEFFQPVARALYASGALAQ